MQKEYTIDEIGALATKLISLFKHKIILLKGDLGAGKTTLVKAIAQAFGNNNDVSSPTFGIANEVLMGNQTAFHLDLYRIENPDELAQFGFEEYLHGDGYCFIEWPEIAAAYINQPHHIIELNTTTNNTRTISFI